MRGIRAFKFSTILHTFKWGCCGRDHMVVGFTTIYTMSTYHNYSCEFESCSWRDVLDTTLCNKVCL
jgi:hypothetical protein